MTPLRGSETSEFCIYKALLFSKRVGGWLSNVKSTSESKKKRLCVYFSNDQIKLLLKKDI